MARGRGRGRVEDENREQIIQGDNTMTRNIMGRST
jgi:hypothetical protein